MDKNFSLLDSWEDGNAKNYDVERTWFQYISLEESHLKCLLWEPVWFSSSFPNWSTIEVPRFSPWRWERMMGVEEGRWQNVILIGKRLFRLNLFFQLSLQRISCLCFTGLRKLIKNLLEYEKDGQIFIENLNVLLKDMCVPRCALKAIYFYSGKPLLRILFEFDIPLEWYLNKSKIENAS